MLTIQNTDSIITYYKDWYYQSIITNINEMSFLCNYHKFMNGNKI